jgi:hypothetical protein
MEIEILSRQNPWWIKKEAIENDEDMRKWKAGRRWLPFLLERIVLKPFSLNFIFGPRQVGKTTLLKLLIKKLLEEGIDGKRIFYFRCDKLSNFKELDEVIKTYLEFRESEKIESSFILLDEITFPTEWYRTIKFYIDTGDLRRDVLVLTGSLSMYLRGEVELFPGRRGHGKDYTMLPLSFREFIKIFAPEVYQKLPRLESLEKDEIFRKAYKLLPYSKEINKLFKKYLELGGFPLCVKNESITEEIKETYWSWIRTDLAKIDRNEETLKRVAKAVLEKAPSAISLNSIAKEFEIGTHKTAYEYINIMKKIFIVEVLYWLEPDKLVSSFKKNRKIVFMDPFFFYLFSDVCMSKLPDKSVIVESIVVSHLARRYDVFFWKNRREIDVIVRNKKNFVGFEIKWREKVKEDYSRISIGKIKNIFCLTKDEINKEKNLLPITIFLSLI